MGCNSIVIESKELSNHLLSDICQHNMLIGQWMKVTEKLTEIERNSTIKERDIMVNEFITSSMFNVQDVEKDKHLCSWAPQDGRSSQGDGQWLHDDLEADVRVGRSNNKCTKKWKN